MTVACVMHFSRWAQRLTQSPLPGTVDQLCVFVVTAQTMTKQLQRRNRACICGRNACHGLEEGELVSFSGVVVHDLVLGPNRVARLHSVLGRVGGSGRWVGSVGSGWGRVVGPGVQGGQVRSGGSGSGRGGRGRVGGCCVLGGLFGVGRLRLRAIAAKMAAGIAGSHRTSLTDGECVCMASL